MKTLFTTIAIIICQMSFAQFGERVQAFDAAIHISGGVRSGQDLTTAIAIGISGRRLPLSLFVGGNIMEFDNDYINMGLTHPSTWGVNATAMARITHIDFRSMDFNVYSTIYKQPKIFMEYGCKTGMLANDRTRLYLLTGYLTGKAQGKSESYHSVVIGASISLFFFNGYSAY
jgi:hypothetical protein